MAGEIKPRHEERGSFSLVSSFLKTLSATERPFILFLENYNEIIWVT
jgi:hypothetical protein